MPRLEKSRFVGADGERDNITVKRDIMREMGEGEGAFDWVCDRPATTAAKRSTANPEQRIA